MKKERIKAIIRDIGLIFIFIFIINAFSFMGGAQRTKEISYNQFLEMVDEGKVESVEISDEMLTAKLYDDNTEYNTGYVQYDNLVDKLYDAGVDFKKAEDSASTTSAILSVLFNILFYFGPVILLLYFFTKIQGAGKMLNAKPQQATLDKNTGVTFNDVAGQEEAKEQLSEIIDFLHNPKKYQEIGAKIPKGALLIGPPGTGKTLLAKAVAGEAHVPFFSVTGSDFIEMYVGVGASRIRDLFERAKQNAPCIIFIDEVDSIAKSRDSGVKGGANDERDQTLNQLLSEMDGFDSSKGIVILAATNRPEILDKAFLRAGRFDRKIIVERPDFVGRVATLKVHAKKVNLSDDVDFDAIAYATTGCVGADLENIVNEAALRAVKMGRKKVIQEDLMESVETVIAGKEKKNRVMSERERRLVAFHEVGHAVVAAMQNNTSPVQKITIIPRTKGSLGYTLQVPEEEKFLSSKDEMLEDITTFYGGRCAEEIFFNTITTGASNDIERASEIARQMVTMYGMSDRFDLMNLESIQNRYLDGTAIRNCSEATSTIIDEEVLKIVKSCHEKAYNYIQMNKDLITEVAEFLLKKESITGEEFMSIFNKYHPEKKIKMPEIKKPTNKLDDKKPVIEASVEVKKEIVEENSKTSSPNIVDTNKTEIVSKNNKTEEKQKEEIHEEAKIQIPDNEQEKQTKETKKETSKPIRIDPPKEKNERPSASVLGPKKKKKKSKATADDIQNLLKSTQNQETQKENQTELLKDINSPEDKKPEKKKLYESSESEEIIEAAGKAGKANPEDYANNKDLDDISEDMF